MENWVMTAPATTFRQHPPRLHQGIVATAAPDKPGRKNQVAGNADITMPLHPIQFAIKPRPRSDFVHPHWHIPSRHNGTKPGIGPPATSIATFPMENIATRHLPNRRFFPMSPKSGPSDQPGAGW